MTVKRQSFEVRHQKPTTVKRQSFVSVEVCFWGKLGLLATAIPTAKVDFGLGYDEYHTHYGFAPKGGLRPSFAALGHETAVRPTGFFE
jgi:hypothetical protein